jgi:hypothetical protein
MTDPKKTAPDAARDEDEKLDSALEDSFPASEPPQMTEPKTAADEKAEKDARD